MTASIAWFDMVDRDIAAATRLHDAALRVGFEPDVSVRLVRAALARPLGAAPAFASRWRRDQPGSPSRVREAA